MFRIYTTLFVISIVGSISTGAYFYYTSTQNTIATLRKNNAKLEVVADTATESLETMRLSVEETNERNIKLQNDLQAAEAYTDRLRAKFAQIDLVQEALKDPSKLEGKMNGATAKLWRNFMQDSGNPNIRPLPEWLRRRDTGSESGNESRAIVDSNSGKTKANTAK
jgi:FtsZ-binding cell division protein ZapB